jgi:hypothetical protein
MRQSRTPNGPSDLCKCSLLEIIEVVIHHMLLKSPASCMMEHLVPGVEDGGKRRSYDRSHLETQQPNEFPRIDDTVHDNRGIIFVQDYDEGLDLNRESLQCEHVMRVNQNTFCVYLLLTHSNRIC